MDDEKRLIIFDLDGTLVDVSERWYGLHLDLSKVYGYVPIPREKYVELKRGRINEKDIINQTDILPEKVDSYIKRRIELIELEKYLRKDKLKPGIPELLGRLSKSHTLVLLTERNNEKNCREEIDRLGIRKYFYKILVSGSLTKDEMVKENFDPAFYKDSVLVGDTKNDLDAARNLGIECWLVCDGVSNRECLSSLKPDCILDEVSQIEWKR